MSKGEDAKLSEEWSQLCVHFTGDTLDAVSEIEGNSNGGSHEWILALGHEMLSQLASPMMPPRLKSCILGHLGPLLARTPGERLLPHAIPSMLSSVTNAAHASESGDNKGSIASSSSADVSDLSDFESGGMRLGCAIGMGGAAASHFDAIADSLTKTLKDLSGPSTSTVADFLMSQVTSMLTEQRPQHAIEADVATAVLCLGYAAAHAPPAQLAPRATPILTTILAAAKSARGEALRGCAAKALELLAKVLCSHPNCAASCQAGTRDEAVELLLRFLSSSLRSAYDHKQQLRAARRLQLPALHASALLISLPPRPPPKTCATLVQGLLQILQADVLAARAPPEQGGPPNGATDFRPVDLQAVAEETYRHRQLMGVCHAVLGSLLALRGPPPTGLFPLLAALLPLALSSYPLLRFRTMEVAARLLQKQLAS